MKVGTKSVLLGAHQFLIHPTFLFIAWWKLYGFPADPRLWLSFFLHDLGYWGKPNMDGDEGETHPLFAAEIMGRLFGRQWFNFCYYHSRFVAKKHNAGYSRLCVADKLAVSLEPAWLYLPRVILSGEIHEYMKLARARAGAGESKYSSMLLNFKGRREWFKSVTDYMRRWAYAHRYGQRDTWTPENGIKKALDINGVK